MYLSPSKYWWAYLAIRSNPLIIASIDNRFDRAVFFDHVSQLPAMQAGASKYNNQYFYIFWDGLPDEGAIEKAKNLLGQHADFMALVVGDFSPQEEHKVESLYAEGSLAFNALPYPFDLRTAAILLVSKIKTILMPLKNIFQNKGNLWSGIRLLFGKKRVVFCGAYGIVPNVIQSFCRRYSIDHRLFDRYSFYSNDSAPSLETYRKYLRNGGLFFADLYDRSEIGGAFFLSVVHLLSRQYFIEKLRSIGVDTFVNGYATGINVNVYTTPFYSQHVFIDFGSAVGTGNYPRLADLQYFRKKVVPISINEELETLLARARTGSLEEHFDQEWKRKAPLILGSME